MEGGKKSVCRLWVEIWVHLFVCLVGLLDRKENGDRILKSAFGHYCVIQRRGFLVLLLTFFAARVFGSRVLPAGRSGWANAARELEALRRYKYRFSRH